MVLGSVTAGQPAPRCIAAVLRWLPVALATVMLLGPCGAPALGQQAASPSATSTVPKGEVFNPDLSQPLQGTQAEEAETDEPLEGDDAETTEEEPEVVTSETIRQAGWGSAADQTPEAKHTEAVKDCEGTPPPTSKMLGLPGSVQRSEGGSLGWLALVIAGGALVVAGLAYWVRRRRGPSASRGSLESVATVVGILGGIAGLAVQFVPGVGVHETPGPAVKMTVRDVNARIPRLEYAKKVNSKKLPKGEDRLEVGNVIWLEIRLEGYRDKKPSLQYGLYDPAAGNALLPGTAVVTGIPHGDADVETQFVPIWVGYPLSPKFQAAFRLLDGDRVQAVAETDNMPTSKYRYRCRR
jgi:hypothetical protein